MADRLLKVILDVVPKAGNAFASAFGFSGPGSTTQKSGAATQRDTSKYLSEITDGFSRMHKELAKLQVAMRPELIAKQANLEMRLADAREKHAKALEREKQKAVYGDNWLLPHLPGAKKGADLAKMFGFNQKSGATAGAVIGGTSTVAGAALSAAGGIYAGGMASVGARSPATLERFERSLMDMTAVIGETFVPVMELSTDVVQLFADVLNSIMPTAGEMREVLAPLRDEFEQLREDIKPLIPFLRDLMKMALQDLARQIQAAAVLIKVAVKLMQASGLYGIVARGGGEIQSSTGMAATSSSFMGGEEYGKAAYSSAFAAGVSKDAASRIADSAEETAKNTQEMADGIGKLIDIFNIQDNAKSYVQKAVKGFIGWAK